MHYFLLSLVFVLLQVCSLSQINTKRIYEKSTTSPISFATIKILHTNKGVVANVTGEFTLNIEPADSVLISSVGYQTKIFIGKEIDSIIYLEPKIKKLTEVFVSNKKIIKTVLLGNGVSRLSKKIKCDIGPTPDKIYDCYPWGSGEKTEFAEKINLPDSNLSYKMKIVQIPVTKRNCWGPLLLHIYLGDRTSAYPGEEIFSKPIYIDGSVLKKSKVLVELARENIYIKGQCFFIGVSWLTDDQEGCLTRISILRSNKGESFTRTLASLTYDWFSFGHMNGQNGPFEVRTFFAVQLEELK